jgi:hypothetical protein
MPKALCADFLRPPKLFIPDDAGFICKSKLDLLLRVRSIFFISKKGGRQWIASNRHRRRLGDQQEPHKKQRADRAEAQPPQQPREKRFFEGSISRAIIRLGRADGDRALINIAYNIVTGLYRSHYRRRWRSRAWGSRCRHHDLMGFANLAGAAARRLLPWRGAAAT